MINFRCPNGHPLSAADGRAGKVGQCPRCQAQFVVPATGEEPDGSLQPGPVEPPERPQSVSSTSPDRMSEKFLFLCPNGHKLYGSAAMQGRRGQCPHCNARFLIPARELESTGDADEDEDEDEDDLPAEVDDSDADEAKAGELVWGPLDEDEPVSAEKSSSWAPQSPELSLPPVPVSCHPLAQIIRRIWIDPFTAGTLEIRLSDGTALQAVSFSAELSQHEYGVFAVHPDAHTTDVAVIPWDHIVRVTLHHVTAMPDDLGQAATADVNRSRPDRLR